MVENFNLDNIAVIGAGVMGREIAQDALMAGFEMVFLYSRSIETLNKAKKFIENFLFEIHYFRHRFNYKISILYSFF